MPPDKRQGAEAHERGEEVFVSGCDQSGCANGAQPVIVLASVPEQAQCLQMKRPAHANSSITITITIIPAIPLLFLLMSDAFSPFQG